MNTRPVAPTQRTRKSFFLPLLLLPFLLLLLLSALPGYANDQNGDPIRYHDKGVLTAIDSSSVIIDDKRFPLDTSVLLVDSKGRPTSAENITPPLSVAYEYTYKELQKKSFSPVIVYIEATGNQDTAQGVHNE